MRPTIFAAFQDVAAATRAMAALIQAGAPGLNLTLVCKNMEPLGEPVEGQQVGAMTTTFPDLQVGGPGSSTGGMSGSSMGSRLAGLAATANASTNPGAMTDLLWDSLPDEMVHAYQKDFDGGLAIVIVREPAESVEATLRQCGALNLHRHGYLA